MPGGFNIGGQFNFADAGSQTGSSAGTTVTASGSTNTKGSYAQLIASTLYDATGFFLQLAKTSSVSQVYLVDVAVGAAASEVVIAPNLLFQSQALGGTTSWVFIPFPIPAGSRVAVRCQSATASATVTASIIMADGAFNEGAPLGNIQDYGTNTGTSLGTVVDAGATANTKGAWTQLTASTTYDIDALLLMFTLGANFNNTTASGCLIDIGVGAAASEVVLIPNVLIWERSGGSYPSYFPLFKASIPAGSRIAARAQCNVNTSSSRQPNLAVLGFS